MLKSPEKKVLIVVGSRPEAIKMAPVYLAFKRAHIPVLLCVTCYNDPFITEVLSLFTITADIILPVAACAQDYLSTLQSVTEQSKHILASILPCLVVVQGDSASALAVALAAFYLLIPIAHVEAGLRTDDVCTPFPDEMHRRLITIISTFHFAPTMAAVTNILTQGIRREYVFCTGNTGFDALMIIKDKIAHKQISLNEHIIRTVTAWHNNNMFIGLITLGNGSQTEEEINSFFTTIKTIMYDKKDCAWVIVHADNPEAITKAEQLGFDLMDSVLLMNTMSYKDMVFLLDTVDIVLTDSGSVHEEAVSLGKPVLILRHKTERMEGVLAGQAQVVGFSPLLIMHGIEQILYSQYREIYRLQHLYGDAHAAEKIAAFVQVRYPELIQSVFVHRSNYYQQKEV